MPPHVDVVVVFRAALKRTPLPKEQTRKNAARAERQYTALMDTLTRAGLNAVGRRGENQGQLLVLVTCPPDLLIRLVHRERSVAPWLCWDTRLTSRFSITRAYSTLGIPTFCTVFLCRGCLPQKQTSILPRSPPRIAYGSCTPISRRLHMMVVWESYRAAKNGTSSNPSWRSTITNSTSSGYDCGHDTG